LEGKLTARNYPQKLISDNFERAKQKNRRDLIFNPKKAKGKDNKIRLIFTHNAPLDEGCKKTTYQK
jgi:hypothetical protein